MKQLVTAVLVVLTLAGCQTMQFDAQNSKPTVFCTVVQEPDPVLLGGWRCTARVPQERGAVDINPVNYWLIRVDGQYALYFERIARDGRKHYRAWEPWTISGKTITSDTGVTIYTENWGVFFRFRDERPEKMTRIESSKSK
jgi:hypothetical protein